MNKKLFSVILIFFVFLALLFYINFEKKADKACEAAINKNVCYHELAQEKSDASLCKRIEFPDSANTKDSRRACLIGVYFKIALERKDPNVCEEIEYYGISPYEERDRCFKEVAWKTYNKSICKSIKTEFIKNSCYEFIVASERSESDCEKEQIQTSKDSCYNIIAMRKLNANLCEKAGILRDVCYYELAKKKLDENLCEKPIDNSYRNNCYHSLAVLKKDLSLCDKISGDQPYVTRDCTSEVQREIEKSR